MHATHLQVIAELERRSQVLKQQIDFWHSLVYSKKQGAGWGIHYSQIESVVILLNQIKQDQLRALDRLRGHQGRDSFAEMYQEVEDQLSYVHEVTVIFRHILAQREGQRFDRPAIDAADLIAASCCALCIERARDDFKLDTIINDRYRVPPLTYLNAEVSPMVLTRARSLGAAGFKMWKYFETQLPMPLILLPLHHTMALWTFCAIHHEVGHILDDDLRLGPVLEEILGKRQIHEQRINDWKRWARELIADCFGVLLGGEGFAYTLMKLLLQARPVKLSQYPPTHLRVGFLGALLRATGVAALNVVASALEQEWSQVAGEPGTHTSYRADCDTVADALLNTRLDVLNQWRLRDFNPDLDRDHQQIYELADYLSSGISRPIKTLRDFHDRLTPAAAQIAIREATRNYDQLTQPLETTCKAIHDNGIGFIRHKLPGQLAPPELYMMSHERRRYLEELTANLDLRHLLNGEP